MTSFKSQIPAFDSHLGSLGLEFEAVVIGGAALQLLDVIERATKDCDVLSPVIPEPIKTASESFASKNGLQKDWLNNGPESLIRDLPSTWRHTLVPLYEGKNLRLLTLSRDNLIRSKLYAYVDRGIDEDDLVQLAPTRAEIDSMMDWLKERDGNPDWPEYVEAKLAELWELLNETK